MKGLRIHGLTLRLPGASGSIPGVSLGLQFSYLFDTYGDVTIEELSQLQRRLEGSTFSTSEPVDTIFGEVEIFAKMCKFAGAALTETQICNFGYMHMLKLLKYKPTLKEWNKKPKAD